MIAWVGTSAIRALGTGLKSEAALHWDICPSMDRSCQCSWHPHLEFAIGAAPQVEFGPANLPKKAFAELTVGQILDIGVLLFAVCILFVKVSILTQYLQMFSPPGFRSAMFWVCHSLLWANIIFYCSCTIILLASIQYSWKLTAHDPRHVKVQEYNITAAAMNSISDIILLIIPQFGIWKLQMPTRRKVQVSAIFFIGFS